MGGSRLQTLLLLPEEVKMDVRPGHLRVVKSQSIYFFQNIIPQLYPDFMGKWETLLARNKVLDEVFEGNPSE